MVVIDGLLRAHQHVSLSVLVAFHNYMRLYKVLVSKDQGATSRPKAVWYLPAAPVNESGLTTADTEYGGVFMRRLLNPLPTLEGVSLSVRFARVPCCPFQLAQIVCSAGALAIAFATVVSGFGLAGGFFGSSRSRHVGLTV